MDVTDWMAITVQIHISKKLDRLGSVSDSPVFGPASSFVDTIATYRVVQLNSTQEIEVLCMLFNKALSIFTMTSIKKHIKFRE